MDVSKAKNNLQSFYACKDYCVVKDEATTTWMSCGATLLASALVSSRSAQTLSRVTGFPVAFTGAVILVADSVDYLFSIDYADLLVAVHTCPGDFDKIEKAINYMMLEFWANMECEYVGLLNRLRGGYLLGGKQQDWVHDEEEFGPVDLGLTTTYTVSASPR